MAAGSSSNAIRVARPSFSVGGQDRAALADGLLNMAAVETTAGLYRCEATFGNWGPQSGQTGFLYFDAQILDFGKPFQVTVGTTVVFSGKITGIEGQFPDGRPPEITVLAEDSFQDMRMTRRTRSFENLSDSDVMQRIAGEYGLTPQIDVQGPTYKFLAQTNQSDLAFLRERARAVDAELWIDGTTLHAQSHANRNAATVRISQGGQLRAFSVSADLAGQSSSATCNGWDVAGKTGLQYEATDSILSAELNGGRSGAGILKNAFGERKQALAHTVPLNSSEAQSMAEAFFKRTARRFVVGHGIAQTDDPLRVGMYVDLDGLGPWFNGKYYVAEARHLFDGRMGFRTEFTGERPGLGQPS
jgi:phage protein D